MFSFRKRIQFGISRSFYSSADTKQNLPCITGPSSDKCDSFLNKVTNSPDYKNLTPDLQQTVLQLGKGIEQINNASSLSDSNLYSINSILKGASGLNALMNKKQKETQAQLKKNGSKFNIIKEGEKFSQGMKAIMLKGLKDNKMTTNQMAALLGAGFTGLKNESNSVIIDKKTKLKNKKDFPVGALNNGKLASPAAAGVNGLTVKNGLETAPENPNAGTSKDKYEITNLDISTNKNDSIFQLLSDRYLKSGIPRLFDRQQDKLPEKRQENK